MRCDLVHIYAQNVRYLAEKCVIQDRAPVNMQVYFALTGPSQCPSRLACEDVKCVVLLGRTNLVVKMLFYLSLLKSFQELFQLACRLVSLKETLEAEDKTNTNKLHHNPLSLPFLSSVADHFDADLLFQGRITGTSPCFSEWLSCNQPRWQPHQISVESKALSTSFKFPISH